MTRPAVRLIVALGGVLAPAAAAAQTTLDHVDPARVGQTLPSEPRPIGALPVGIVQAPPPTHAGGDAPITVGAISLTGLVALHPSDFADIIETYVGRTLSPAALAGLADAISERARARGFLFATTTIPPQKIEAGMLRLVVDEGRVDEIRITGTDNSAAHAALTPLVGFPVSADQLQRRLLIAADIDGLLLRRVRLLHEGSRNVLLVEMGERRVSGVVDLDNTGTRPIGPLRADASVRISQILAADDALVITAATNPLMPQELGYGRVRYSKRLDADGTEVSASASYATVTPGSYLADRDIVGRSWTAQLGVSRPLLRRRATSAWLLASFDVRSVKQYWAGELARRDRLASFRLGVYGYTAVAGGVLHASVTLSQGITAFGAPRAGDPFASRSGAGGSYTSLIVETDWQGRLSGPFSVGVAATGQIAGEPLLISEQFGLGGGAYLRPYDYNERSGDNGVAGSVELRYALPKKIGPLRDPSLYIFTGGGYSWDMHGGPATGSLFASGGGVRAGLGPKITADAGVAFPLSGPRYDTGSSTPVFSLRISLRF